jgi:hypothetical protein
MTTLLHSSMNMKKFCKTCNKEFTGIHGKKEYCSSKCYPTYGKVYMPTKMSVNDYIVSKYIEKHCS